MDLSAICLFCLGPHDCINVLSYLDGKTKLSTVLGQISGVEYPRDVKLPSNVCETCFDKTRGIYSFQQMCKSSLESIVPGSSSSHQPVAINQVSRVFISNNVTNEVPLLMIVPPPPLIKQPEEDEYEKLQVDDESAEEEEEYDDFVVDAEEEENDDFVVEDGEDEFQGDYVIVHEEDLIAQEEDEELIQCDRKKVKSKQAVSTKKTKSKRAKSRRIIKKSLGSPIANAPIANVKRNFGCHECDQYFETYKKLQLHNKSVHDTETADSDFKIFYCMKCLRKFESTDILKSHESDCTGDEALKKPFPCTICLKRFTYQTEVKQHQKEVHEPQKKYPCPLCDQKFTRSSQITIHMRGHTNERPYECPVCKAGFTKSTNRARHMIKHNEDSSGAYCCSVCDKSFKWETSLKVHLNTHSKIRQFKCEHCEKDYTSISGLRKHEQTQHGQME